MSGSSSTRIIWAPQPGPQKALIDCPLDEIFYGGARGGGKTDGMLGKFALKASRYPDAVGVFFRRTREDLKEAVERSQQIYAPLGAVWHEQKKWWRFPNGARLKFEYLDNDRDADNYQGHNYCVALGTRIRMADGSLRAIEDIAVGDVVMTLEGGRAVRRVTTPYEARCVEYRVFRGEYEVGRQVHPLTHPVLTSVSGPLLRSDDIHRSGGPSRPDRVQWHSVEPHPSRHRGPWAADAWTAGEASDYRGSAGGRREDRRPLRLSVPVMLARPDRRSDAPCSGASTRCHKPGISGRLSRAIRPSRLFFAFQETQRRGERARRWLHRTVSIFGSLIAIPCGYAFAGPVRDAGFPAGCRLGRRSGGARLHPASEAGRFAARRQGDAEARGRDGSGIGGRGYIPSRSHVLRAGYTHPYSGELRRREVPLESGRAEVRYAGVAWVSDLTVEGANHYITESGLVNVNTDLFFEELTHWPDPAPVNKLRATLRSATGVPCQFHATGNPGGPGHQWVKARYVDPAPQGMEVIEETFTSPFDGETTVKKRVFIPSSIRDNRYLDKDYIASLYQSGSETLVRAWLMGDWSVIEGAFFDCWRPDKHILRPMELPEHWLRFRALDWGSARPFSVGWYAVASEDYITDQGVIPRNALIRYREWYGMKEGEPNTGLKMTVEEVGSGIVERTNEKISYSVADPAIFAEDGGPSMAERFVKSGVAFRPADNTRVARRGRMGGWDQVRARLIGGDDKPMLYVFSTNTHLIRTLPAAQHDEKMPEDVDTESEDHAIDELRYACMSRPYTRPKPEPARPLVETRNPTLQELMESIPEKRNRI